MRSQNWARCTACLASSSDRTKDNNVTSCLQAKAFKKWYDLIFPPLSSGNGRSWAKNSILIATLLGAPRPALWRCPRSLHNLHALVVEGFAIIMLS